MMMTMLVAATTMTHTQIQQLGFDHHYPCPSGGVFPWKMSSAGDHAARVWLCAPSLFLKCTRQAWCSSTTALESSGVTHPKIQNLKPVQKFTVVVSEMSGISVDDAQMPVVLDR